MEAITLPIYNTEGKEVDNMKLPSSVFAGSVNAASVYQAICAYRANQRKGLAATKTRGEVSGGGRKPWKQKGTGRSRHGSTRSPLWRHGGVVFGPHPRDFSYSLPRKIRIAALKSALYAKAKEGNFIVIDNFNLEGPKTKEAIKIFSNLKIGCPKAQKGPGARNAKALLLLDKTDKNLRLALRNISFVDVDSAKDTHVYEVLSHKKLIVTKSAFSELTDRLGAIKDNKAIAEQKQANVSARSKK